VQLTSVFHSFQPATNNTEDTGLVLIYSLAFADNHFARQWQLFALATSNTDISYTDPGLYAVNNRPPLFSQPRGINSHLFTDC